MKNMGGFTKEEIIKINLSSNLAEKITDIIIDEYEQNFDKLKMTDDQKSECYLNFILLITCILIKSKLYMDKQGVENISHSFAHNLKYLLLEEFDNKNTVN